MSTTTTNLSLVKPANNENVDISVINDNYDKIDQFAGGVANVTANPSGTATETLSKLTVGSTIYGIPVGSTVSATPIVQSGTKIATININGTDYDLYAPTDTGDTVTWNQIQLTGTKIASISISGNSTDIYAPSGGTTVVANPVGSATADLATLQVGNVIYAIPQGGGSLTPNGVTYVIDTNGTDSVQTGFDYAYAQKITKYVDGVYDSTGSFSYAQAVTTPTNHYIVGNLRSTFSTIDGTSYWITTVEDGYVSYNGTTYEATEEIFRIAVRGGSVVQTTGFEEMEEAGGSTVSWNQVVATGTKIATITIDGTPTDVYAPTSSGASTFAGLSDVDLTSLADGQVAVYNGSSSKWENETLSLGDTVSYTDLQQSGTKIGTLTINSIDYDIYAPTGGGSASALNDLSDVTLTTPSNGQVLKYDGANSRWINANETGGGASDLDDLTDVDITSATTGQTLVYNSTTSKWENEDLVVANPQGSASVELEKLQIGNTIYSLPSGGSGSGLQRTNLYTASTTETTISLSQSIQEFDFIEFVSWYNYGGNDYTQNAIYSADDLVNSISTDKIFGVFNDAWFTYYRVNDVDELECIANNNSWYIKQVYGYKFGGGSGSASWTDYEDTLTAGSTSLTITGFAIKTTSVVEIYTDKYGVNPDDVVVTNGQIVLTFEAQSSDLGVLVRITENGASPIVPFDIDLHNFVTDKIWYYYDEQETQQPVATATGISIVGSEYIGGWTTSGSICIDLNKCTIPATFSKMKIHFPTITTTDYGGICVLSNAYKYDGTTGGSDAILRQGRLEISSGIYVLEDSTNGLQLTDYTLEIPVVRATLLTNRYLYIVCLTGVQEGWNGTTNTYNNSLNGSYNITIDGIWFE